ncbi:cytochrome o ubiquinol oxidase operon protein cyoD [Sphingopyxis panaciterrae]|uniref:cytochrome o ubiquinol oxidase subunit IV n=1 Tax=Sphingopyxis panaciterrae TaxID=363841 RepID=UPI00141DA6A3|nr:cytochrome o ubiquinol oxidase subunit IV [Sphingopyxis panaciterrae]NIJ35850.1 cytochrome o ubiquinol oxidase operon protein cyoD [Sphingopyxis panaciterrae]
MSADPHHAADAHHEIEMPHASMRDYAIGFILSVILTAIPFWLVMERPFSAGATAAIIMGFAAVQIVVHMVYFLHMTPKAEGGWSMTSLIFTIIVVVIMLAGSLWVMHHLNTNMMPMPHDPSQLP